MGKIPFVKPLSKAAVGSRLAGIFSIFKSITFGLASAFMSLAANTKDGLMNQNKHGRE